MANFDKRSPHSEQKSSFSEHFLALSEQDKERYIDKLTVEGQRIPDPYTIPDKFWENNCCKWPNIEYGDVWNYLVHTPGLYTQEAMKAYKSLDGYNFFISGHVQPVLYRDIQDTPVCILTAKVIPSQKVSDKKQWHHPWLMVNKRGGYIVAAHCSCKAGAGEACSHIAAVLFKVEAAIKLGLNNPAKTSLANQWNKCYREKVTAQPLSEINFSRPVHGKVQRKRKALIEPPSVLTEFEEAEALRSLKRVCPDACILTKDDSDTDTASDDEEMPPVLVREHTICCESLTPDELMKECENLLEDFKVTPVQASNLEKMTRAQAESVLWKRQRVGRITASLVHDIKTLKESTDPSRCVASVMRYCERDLGSIEHVSYGLRNERKAKELYFDVASKEHDKFNLRDCGLVIDTTFPVFAASPDGVRTCACHGEGLVEVKCCSAHRDIFVSDIPEIHSDFFLEPQTLKLKENHRYFTQVQFQMYVCQKQFCDFIVYTDKGIFFQTVYYQPSFVKQLIEKCLEFSFSNLLPEIISRKIEN